MLAHERAVHVPTTANGLCGAASGGPHWEHASHARCLFLLPMPIKILRALGNNVVGACRRCMTASMRLLKRALCRETGSIRQGKHAARWLLLSSLSVSLTVSCSGCVQHIACGLFQALP